jgi:hypothetical protein
MRGFINNMVRSQENFTGNKNKITQCTGLPAFLYYGSGNWTVKGGEA